MIRISKHWTDTNKTQVAYKTGNGTAYQSSIEDFVSSRNAGELDRQVQLILTSPPFPLASPKEYGNQNGSQYTQWLENVFCDLVPLLKPSGSLVVEIGNAWDKGSPTMSTVPLETLLAIHKSTGLALCQQFIAHNPNRLPSPATYVNRERIRVKDSFTHIWWFGKRERPYANNRHVLNEYSPAMKRLLKSGRYNAGRRPSEHQIGEKSFLQNNGGSIPSNVLEFSGSEVDKNYQKWCKENQIAQHPARMAEGIVEFFVNFLTKSGDTVFDPFAGSNTTGSVAERLKRNWISVEQNHVYLRGSIGRFKSS